MNSIPVETAPTRARRFFTRIIRWRWPVILVSVLLIAGIGSFIAQISKDTTAEAFVPRDNPALAYRDQVEETFGLKDPMIVAVINDGPDGVFSPDSLALVQWLTDRIQRIEGVDPDRVASLATENNIIGTQDGMLVDGFWETPPATPEAARGVWQSVQDFPLFLGTLVARDGSGTLIVAELLDDSDATRIYFDLLALTDKAGSEGLLDAGDKLHVAGQGAVSGYLAAYIDADATRLNPVAAIVITLVLLLAYRTLAGALLPNLVVLGTIAVGLGSMAAMGVPFYVITNSLPVILIGIAVCDAIHVFSQYYEEIGKDPAISGPEATIRAMTAMWRPVTLTSLTTIAGFLGLAAAADLPPMQSYGVFAAIGITAAWLWSLLLLPACLSLFKPKASPALKPRASGRPDVFTRMMAASGRAVAHHGGTVLVICAALLVVGVIGVTQVEFNAQRIDNFQNNTPLHIADTAINQRFDGTYYLDVAVTTPEPDDLFKPENLERIERLQAWMETEGGLANTTSIVDYIKEMHRSINEDRETFYRIPDDPQLIAQYFLLYSASGEPTDFQEEIDYDYRQAHVRGLLADDNFQRIEPIVLGLERYLAEEFNTPSIQGHATGDIDLTYSWLQPLGSNTAKGMALAMTLVLLASAAFFRSLVLGALATLPVALAVLMVFAVMGYAGIWLGVGTSMFAAIAIGLGVDFAIHTLDRLRSLIRDRRMAYADAAAELFPTTGRALLFNLLALVLGFGVIMISSVPPLQDFGLLVAIAVVTSFVASLTAMPALIGLIRPRALFNPPPRQEKPMSDTPQTQRGFAHPSLLAGLAALLLVGTTLAQDLPEAGAVMSAVDQRDEGVTQRSNITFELTDRRGKTRRQETVALRKYYGDDKRQVLFYLEPSNVRDTAFLTYDYADADRDDDQWLYLPALRKSRRISASDRGDYFLGTDLTYEDLKRQNKVSLEDWNFTTVGRETVDDTQAIVIEGTPVNETVAEELGYGKGRWYVDPSNHTIMKSENWDIQGNRLKTARFGDIRKVDGIWTVHDIAVENHKTGHRTHMIIEDVAYGVDVRDGTFEERTLRRGFRG